jgi:hypothetical protein
VNYTASLCLEYLKIREGQGNGKNINAHKYAIEGRKS